MNLDLGRPDAAACIHRGLAVDADALVRRGVAVAACADGDPRATVADALRFPVWYGRNWDALDECLRDLADWWPARGWVLVAERAEDPGWDMLQSCWRDAAAVHAAAGRSLHLVLGGNVDGGRRLPTDCA